MHHSNYSLWFTRWSQDVTAGKTALLFDTFHCFIWIHFSASLLPRCHLPDEICMQGQALLLQWHCCNHFCSQGWHSFIFRTPSVRLILCNGIGRPRLLCPGWFPTWSYKKGVLVGGNTWPPLTRVSKGLWKTDASPVCAQWSYISFTPTHRYIVVDVCQV